MGTVFSGSGFVGSLSNKNICWNLNSLVWCGVLQNKDGVRWLFDSSLECLFSGSIPTKVMIVLGW